MGDPDCKATITDVSGAYAQLNIQGPNSRKLMSKITSYDMSNDNFPFRTFQEIDIGYARVFCARITYVGELGYELFIPVENALHVYDRLIEAEPNLKAVGLQALGSLRMEKGYRDYGHDIDNTDTLMESGLSFTADFKTETTRTIEITIGKCIGKRSKSNDVPCRNFISKWYCCWRCSWCILWSYSRWCSWNRTCYLRRQG